jgi:hypothetical protein
VTRRAVQGALESWFVSILIAGSFTFALGVLGFVAGIPRSGGLSRGLAWLVVVVALIVMAASRFVPLFAVQLYLQAAAALVALWPLAHRMWTRSPATEREAIYAPRGFEVGRKPLIDESDAEPALDAFVAAGRVAPAVPASVPKSRDARARGSACCAVPPVSPESLPRAAMRPARGPCPRGACCRLGGIHDSG